jgi:hypothetical protein
MSQKYGANTTGLSRVFGVANSTTSTNFADDGKGKQQMIWPIVKSDKGFVDSTEEGWPSRGADKNS